MCAPNAASAKALTQRSTKELGIFGSRLEKTEPLLRRTAMFESLSNSVHSATSFQPHLVFSLRIPMLHDNYSCFAKQSATRSGRSASTSIRSPRLASRYSATYPDRPWEITSSRNSPRTGRPMKGWRPRMVTASTMTAAACPAAAGFSRARKSKRQSRSASARAL